MIQPVDYQYRYNGRRSKVFNMIDNYIYLYHTDTLIAIPAYPESISDSTNTTFATSTPLARSAPIYSYSNSGPRAFAVSINLHRDMMNEINVSTSNLSLPNLSETDYVDTMIKQLQAIALPRYGAAEKMVDPPIIAVRFGNDIFCKGVVEGGVTTTYSGPILSTDKYAAVTVDFSIKEIDPYDADSVMMSGSFRGLNTDLERRVFKSGSNGNTTFGRITL